MNAVSFIIPTIGRSTLERAVQSIAQQRHPGDEILVIGSHSRLPEVTRQYACRHLFCHQANNGGSTERMMGIHAARAPYLAFMDDDDIYLPGMRDAMASAIQETPGRPVLFRMRYVDGRELWSDPEMRMGNISTQMMLIPNDPAKLGIWSTRYESDYDFLATMAWPTSAIVWRPEVIACIRPQ